MIVSPPAAHSFWFSMVWDGVVVARELFVANRAFPILLDNLPIQEPPHFGWRPEFPKSPGMMRILKALHAYPYYCCLAFLSYRFPATAE